jgi:L-ascorbate metabolism protein UlaG (beta-lactamase superfamily)
MPITVKWFAHSTFLMTINGRNLLIDPFISENPLAADTDIKKVPADLIAVTHAHGDHMGDVIAIARRTGAPVVCNFEMGNWFEDKGVAQVERGNPGGTFKGDFVSLKWTIAFHSSTFPDGAPGGEPNGFIITADDRKFYFAGDTNLFGDMELIGDEGIEAAFLPIGDTFTMGVEDSIKAIKLIRPKFVIPMHYNTFPPIVQDVSAWADMVNRETDAQPIVVDPGMTFEL